MPATLTPKQSELLEAIKKFRKQKGYSPANIELAALLGVSAVRIWQQLRCLEIAGEIKILGKKALQVADEIPYTAKQLEVVKAFASNPGATQSQVAALLGISPPVLNQDYLPQLASYGAIEVNDGKVKVLDKTL